MKTKMYIILIAIFFISVSILAQSPPPPNGGNNPNGGNTPVGGGAPVGSGLFVLLALGAAYGSKKVFQLKNTEK